MRISSPSLVMPALFTKMSTAGCSAKMALTQAATASGSATSQGNATQLPG